MAGLDALVIGGQWQLLAGEKLAALILGILEMPKQDLGIRAFEVVKRKFYFVLMEHFAIANYLSIWLLIERQVVNILDILDIHGQTFEPVGDLGANRIAFDAAHLLKI